jgi:hypothetical protein
LSDVGFSSGNPPTVSDDGKTLTLSANGKIYQFDLVTNRHTVLSEFTPAWHATYAGDNNDLVAVTDRRVGAERTLQQNVVYISGTKNTESELLPYAGTVSSVAVARSARRAFILRQSNKLELVSVSLDDGSITDQAEVLKKLGF